MESGGQKALVKKGDASTPDCGPLPGTQFLKHLDLPSTLCTRSMLELSRAEIVLGGLN